MANSGNFSYVDETEP
jgi:hypothetical protein